MGTRLESVAEAALRRLGGVSREVPKAPPRHEIVEAAPACPACPPGPTPPDPERQIFEEILGASDPGQHACYIEPGKPCVDCSGRCRSLGF